jgi:hypothetical protein
MISQIIITCLLLISSAEKPTVQAEMNAFIETDTDSQYIDTMMTTWFEEFNNAQESGHKMFDADLMATEKAIAQLKNRD